MITRINANLLMLAVMVILFAVGYLLSGRDALLGRLAESGFSALLGAGAFAGARALRRRNAKPTKKDTRQ